MNKRRQPSRPIPTALIDVREVDSCLLSPMAAEPAKALLVHLLLSSRELLQSGSGGWGCGDDEGP